MSSDPLLRVQGVTVRFGGVAALRDVSFDVERGKVVGLIGPNGAGKTTLFNCLSRLYTPSEGCIEFEGVELTRRPAHSIAELGIARTFQNLALFDSLTVLQNVMLGAHCRMPGGFLSHALKMTFTQRADAQARQHALDLCELVGLGGRSEQVVAGLPFGLKKRVEFARALASGPKLLLLDEPAVGLNHEELTQLGDRIREVCERLGVTVLLVEHHMALLMRVSDHVVVLDFGEKIAEGTPAQVQAHPEVIRAYLGADADVAAA